jgi:hypothetical protein
MPQRSFGNSIVFRLGSILAENILSGRQGYMKAILVQSRGVIRTEIVSACSLRFCTSVTDML